MRMALHLNVQFHPLSSISHILECVCLVLVFPLVCVCVYLLDNSYTMTILIFVNVYFPSFFIFPRTGVYVLLMFFLDPLV